VHRSDAEAGPAVLGEGSGPKFGTSANVGPSSSTVVAPSAQTAARCVLSMALLAGCRADRGRSQNRAGSFSLQRIHLAISQTVKKEGAKMVPKWPQY